MGGIDFMTFGGTDSEVFENETGFDKSSRTGFALGAFAEWQINNTWAVEPQLLYIQKGAKYKGNPAGGTSGEATIKLDYVQIPVLLKAEYAKEGVSVVPGVFFGPAIGFKVGCSFGVEADGQSDSVKCDDAGASVQDTDFSLVFGAGVELDRLSLQVRYDLGLTNIDRDGAEVHNQGWLISLGYGFVAF
jgi:opacity protein-like surface antigen